MPNTWWISMALQDLVFFIDIFFPILAFIVVVLRTYSRGSTGIFGWDDGLIILAMAISIVETYVSWHFIETNFIGIHIWDVPLHYDPVPGLKYTFWVQVFYNPILAIVKNSILIFLLRLSSSRATVKYSLWALMAVNTSAMIAIFLVVIFQCNPIPYNWDKTITGGNCIDQKIFVVLSAATTIFTDILMLVFPFWIVMGLNMPRRTKIGVIGIFLLGGIVTIVGIIRLVLLVEGFFNPSFLAPDPTYNIGFVTSAVETNLAIMAASAPAVKHLFRRWFPRLWSSAEPTSYTGGPYSRGGARYASRTVGGSSMKGSKKSDANTFEMNSGPGQSEIESTGRGESEEEIMTFKGIVKTTNVNVQFADRAGHGDRDSSKSHMNDYGKRTSVESL